MNGTGHLSGSGGTSFRLLEDVLQPITETKIRIEAGCESATKCNDDSVAVLPHEASADLIAINRLGGAGVVYCRAEYSIRVVPAVHRIDGIAAGAGA